MKLRDLAEDLNTSCFDGSLRVSVSYRRYGRGDIAHGGRPVLGKSTMVRSGAGRIVLHPVLSKAAFMETRRSVLLHEMAHVKTGVVDDRDPRFRAEIARLRGLGEAVEKDGSG
jgi:hypothetical protein